MSDKRLEQYKNEMQQIEVPKELKERTIARMKAQAPENGQDSMPIISAKGERDGNRKQSKLSKWQQTPYAAAAIALLLIGVGAYSQLGGEDEATPIVIAQKLENGSVAEEVALSEGNIIFSKIPTELQSFGMQMGVIEEEEISESEMNYEYQEDEEYEGVGYEIISMEGAIPYEEESLKLAESRIGEISVRIGYYKEKEQTIFLAYFKVGETGYKVKGIGVSQEEFVQKVLSMLQEQ